MFIVYEYCLYIKKSAPLEEGTLPDICHITGVKAVFYTIIKINSLI